MRFHKAEDTSYAYAGTWTLSDDDAPEGFEGFDVELFTIEVEEYDDNVFEVTYFNCQNPKKSWSTLVEIEDGTDWIVFTDEVREIGRVPFSGKGNETENILLGLYDVIELHSNNIEVFYINS